ncbi:MAG: alkaline phosphatase family protein [Nanoarchaeota archaeon]|nr:alkaline phosphatase family protein [Nanoarchaeota archaeon]
MIVVIAIDALEFDLVKEFNYENLKQEFYGKTNISEFSQPRTMVLWSSFMTGENKEKEIVAKDGKKVNWDYKISLEKTFFSKFNKPKIIDLPGFNYDKAVHDKSRNLLKNYFETESSEEKKKILQEYNKDAMYHHKTVREEFLTAIENDYDFILGYFSAIDVIGHLNFGNKLLMKMLYKEMDEITAIVRKKTDKIFVLSDHGMIAIGNFGDNSTHGFWSTNFKELNNPKITDFAKIISGLKK